MWPFHLFRSRASHCHLWSRRARRARTAASPPSIDGNACNRDHRQGMARAVNSSCFGAASIVVAVVPVQHLHHACWSHGSNGDDHGITAYFCSHGERMVTKAYEHHLPHAAWNSKDAWIRLAPHAAAVLPASNLRKSRASGTRATSNHACKILCQPFHCTYVTVLSRHPVRVAPNSMVPGQRSSFGVSVTVSSPRRCPCDATRKRLRAAAAGAASAASAVSVAATTAQAPQIGGAGAKAPRNEQPRRTQRRQQWFPCLLQLGFD